MVAFLSLRLAMYRGLGFEPIVDKDGRMHKMLIRTFVIFFDDISIYFGSCCQAHSPATSTVSTLMTPSYQTRTTQILLGSSLRHDVRH